MSKILDGLNTPGGRSALLGALWVFLLLISLVAKIAHVEIDQEGRSALAHASDILLGGLLLSMNVAPKA